MIAITSEEKYLAKIAGEELTTPEPVLRKEQYLSAIANGEGTTPELPVTREERYLAILAGENYAIPTPETRLERYMAKACGLDIDTPTPITNVEYYWAIIAEGGSWQITTLTGALPLSFLSKGEALTNYHLYGTENGAGEQTVNEFDPAMLSAYPNTSIGAKQNSWTASGSGTVYEHPIEANTDYCLYSDLNGSPVAFYRIAITAANRPTTNAGVTAPWILQETAITNVTFNSDTNTKLLLQLPLGYDVTFLWQHLALVKTNVIPDTFIPFGYQIPLTVTSGEQSGTYPIYIGDTKLQAEEHVDYQEQKVWKMVDGTLTPTDPPVPFPTITTYKGENTLDSSETVGEVSVTGKIKEAENG